MATRLSFDEHVAAVIAAGKVLRDAAAQAGLDAPVPTCPAWDVRNLVTHQGMVHRWAAAHLRGDRDHRTSDSTAEAAAAPDLLGWFSAGVDALVETLHDTSEDAKAMVFLNDAPPPRGFWARRQAHETTIHSADAVAAALGRWPLASDLSISAELAVDGVDELLHGFITRGKGKLRSPEPFTITVSSTDTGDSWTMRVAEDSLTTTDGASGDAAAGFAGTAAQLYLGLWNRGEEMAVRGRADLLDLWRARVRIRWS
jgi:uncharacterized protein (TIGR03083 family)